MTLTESKKISVAGWIYLLAIFATLIISCSGEPAYMEITSSSCSIYANGTDCASIAIRAVADSGRTARIDSPVLLSFSGAEVSLVGENPLFFSNGKAKTKVVSTFEEGEAVVTVKADGMRPGELKIDIVSDFRDRDSDGFPDVTELTGDTDRLNFRRWFTAVAESQLYEKNRRWSDVTTDCAGFIRFSYIEALKIHDEEFFESYSSLLNPSIPNVKKYNYPDVPLLGTEVFRTGSGAFVPEDIDGKFSAAATTGVLLNHNVISIGMSPEKALPGDLLFYFNPDNHEMPYHVMIFLGEWGRTDESEGDEDDWLVYHTGPRETDPGEVRKVRLLTLMEHPDERWRPKAENDHFLGYFRFKILD